MVMGREIAAWVRRGANWGLLLVWVEVEPEGPGEAEAAVEGEGCAPAGAGCCERPAL